MRASALPPFGAPRRLLLTKRKNKANQSLGWTPLHSTPPAIRKRTHRFTGTPARLLRAFISPQTFLHPPIVKFCITDNYSSSAERQYIPCKARKRGKDGYHLSGKKKYKNTIKICIYHFFVVPLQPQRFRNERCNIRICT